MVFLRMATEGKIRLIAIDELHLVYSWKFFRFVEFVPHCGTFLHWTRC